MLLQDQIYSEKDITYQEMHAFKQYSQREKICNLYDMFDTEMLGQK